MLSSCTKHFGDEALDALLGSLLLLGGVEWLGHPGCVLRRKTHYRLVLRHWRLAWVVCMKWNTRDLLCKRSFPRRVSPLWVYLNKIDTRWTYGYFGGIRSSACANHSGCKRFSRSCRGDTLAKGWVADLHRVNERSARAYWSMFVSVCPCVCSSVYVCAHIEKSSKRCARVPCGQHTAWCS